MVHFQYSITVSFAIIDATQGGRKFAFNMGIDCSLLKGINNTFVSLAHLRCDYRYYAAVFKKITHFELFKSQWMDKNEKQLFQSIFSAGPL